MGKVIFLTGAPLPSSLIWEEETLCAPLQPFFVEKSDPIAAQISTAETLAPSWRFLPIEQSHLPTGLTQASRPTWPFGDYSENASETTFLSTADLSSISTDCNENQSRESSQSDAERTGEILSQYYAHSFAIHDELPSSQIIGAASDDSTSFATDLEEISIAYPRSDPETKLALSRLSSAHLSDLKETPNASYLRSITPQTITVNLVVGIISISAPRAICPRRGGRPVELVEMIVGDETRAGFGFNIWLPAPSPQTSINNGNNSNNPADGDLRAQTRQLRPQDVILARTIALSSFKGKVYGQSLRRGMTTLDLLYRNVIGGDEKPGAFRAHELAEGAVGDGQVRKVRDVRDWVMRFVGGGREVGTVRRVSGVWGRGEMGLELLPADTPR